MRLAPSFSIDKWLAGRSAWAGEEKATRYSRVAFCPAPAGRNCPDCRRPAVIRQHWSEVLASFAAAAVLLCPLLASSAPVIWEGNDQSVFLASQDESSAPNDHPASMSPQTLRVLLSDLELRYADEEDKGMAVSVFNEDQVEVLADALAAGLAAAKPSQDINFSVVGAHRLAPGAFARRNRLTAGRVFVHDDKLNIIFGELHSPYRKKNVYGRLEQDFYPRSYGSRTTASNPEYVLVTDEPGSPPEGPRSDWLVLDGHRTDKEPPLATPGNSPRPEPAALPGIASSKAPEVAAQRSHGDGLEQRLRRLKRLRDEELISEEAYRQKMSEILEDL